MPASAKASQASISAARAPRGKGARIHSASAPQAATIAMAMPIRKEAAMGFKGAPERAQRSATVVSKSESYMAAGEMIGSSQGMSWP